MAGCVRGMYMNLWKAMVRSAPQEVRKILRKRLCYCSAGGTRMLIDRLMETYELDVDEALGLFMTLYCLLEDNALFGPEYRQ